MLTADQRALLNTPNAALPVSEKLENLVHAMQFLYEHCALIFGGEAALKQYPSLDIAIKTVAVDSSGRTVNLQCSAWLWRLFGRALQKMAAQYKEVRSYGSLTSLTRFRWSRPRPSRLLPLNI